MFKKTFAFKNWQQIGILCSILLAAFLRIYALDKNPPELFGDELDAGYQAYSLMTTGRDYRGHFLPVYLQCFYEWRAPLLMYSMIPFIKIFGLNEWGLRLTSAFWGIISIIAFSYLLLLLKTKKSIILITCFLLAILPWHIQYSRAAFEITLASSLVILGIAFFFKSFNNDKKAIIILSGLFLGLSFYAYNTTNVISPLFLISSATALFLTKQKPFKKIIKHTLLVGLITIVVALPLIPKFIWGPASARFKAFSVVGHSSIVDKITYYRSQSDKPFLAKIFYNRPLLWTQTIIQNYLGSFSSETLFGQGDVTFRHSLHEIGNLYLFQLPFILLGIFFIIKKTKKSTAEILFLFWLLFSPLPASLTIDGKNHATRLFFLIFPLTYLSALGIHQFFSSIKNKKIAFFIMVALLGWITFSFARYQYFYWVHYPKQSWRWWHYGYKELISEVKERESNYSQVLIESTYEPALIRYLFWSKYDPRKVFRLDITRNYSILGFNGFCLSDKKICFVNYEGMVEPEKLQKDTLYILSQEKNIPGDWNWEKSPPSDIRVIKTIKSPQNQPLFYLIEKV